MRDEKMICAICGAEISRFMESNNPYPVVKDEDAVCCPKCNRNFVIPARNKMKREQSAE